jgi:hypothetical protein
MNIDRLVEKFGKPFSRMLSIDLSDGDPAYST